MSFRQFMVSAWLVSPSFVQTPRIPGRMTDRVSLSFLRTVSGLPTIQRLEAKISSYVAVSKPRPRNWS